MNTEAQKARNARKRAKQRLKARGGTENITRFQVRVELIHRCSFDLGDRCGFIPAHGRKIHSFYASTPGGWVAPYDGAPIHKCKYLPPSEGFHTYAALGDGVHHTEPHVTCISDWVIYGTHDVSSKAREYLEVFNAMVKSKLGGHPEAWLFDQGHIQALTTLTVQQDGRERSTTWRGEVEAVAADVIAVLLL